jgi:hypothetical protein
VAERAHVDGSLRAMFPGYYQKSAAEFELLWRTADIVLDANTLLHVHRRSAATVDEIFELFENLKSRLWVPYQAAYEYEVNRIAVSQKQIDNLRSAIKSIHALSAQVADAVFRENPLYDGETVANPLLSALTVANERLEDALRNAPAVGLVSTTASRLEGILDGRIGTRSNEDEQRWLRLAQARFASKQPPGFRDVNKPEPERYGDAMMWLEVKQYASTNNKPIIFVTDDAKDDWWLMHDGRILGPEPRLLHEFLRDTKQMLHIYKFATFMENAKSFLHTATSSAAVEEVRANEHRLLAQTRDRFSALVELGNLSRRLVDLDLQRASLESYLKGLVESRGSDSISDATLPLGRAWNDAHAKLAENSAARTEVAALIAAAERELDACHVAG